MDFMLHRVVVVLAMASVVFPAGCGKGELLAGVDAVEPPACEPQGGHYSWQGTYSAHSCKPSMVGMTVPPEAGTLSVADGMLTADMDDGVTSYVYIWYAGECRAGMAWTATTDEINGTKECESVVDWVFEADGAFAGTMDDDCKTTFDDGTEAECTTTTSYQGTMTPPL